MLTSVRLLRRVFLALAAIPIALSVLPELQACETPVYRYAMYRWRPAPYELYLMHEKPLSEAEQKLIARLGEIPRAETKPANVVGFAVDLSDENALERVPIDVKQAWLAQKETASTPACLIASPAGIHVHTEALSVEDLTALIDSPARQQMVQGLSQGNAGVLILLKGKDAQQNEAASAVLKQLVADVNAGKVNLYESPNTVRDAGEKGDAREADASSPTATGKGDKTSAGQGEPTAPPKVSLSLLEVDRDDTKEKWLIRQLLAVESDLHEFSEPMVFAIYGRGRALPPYIGKGISRENMLECVEFITGACSCTVKDQNPGVDLLVQANWESIAGNLAEKFGAEEGNEQQFGGGFFPELIVPGGAAPASQPASGPKPGEVAADPAGEAESQTESRTETEPTSLDGSPTVASVNEGSPAKQDGGEVNKAAGDKADGNEESGAAKPESTPADGVPVASASLDETSNDPPANGESSDSEVPVDGSASTANQVADAAAASASTTELQSEGSNTGFTVVAVGLALAVVILFAATFLVLRPQ